MSKVGTLCGSLDLHMQSRGGRCLEWNCVETCGSSIFILRTFIFILFMETPFCLLCHSTLHIHPLVGCNWLLIHVVSVIYKSLSDMWQSEPGLSISSKMSCLFSLCLFRFKAVFSAMIVETYNPLTDKYSSKSRQRNYCPFTKNLAFKRTMNDQIPVSYTCKWEKVLKSDP